ncbi:MAG: NAD(+) synthetase [Candidatus Omnitrophota bacterium]|nr:MAG: NAD(+) synthetase [Candidatus Omnitrophota bacterium]HDN97711.1 NAD+ synthase [bacterium]
MEELKINVERVVDFMVSFIRDEFKKANFRTAIIGLSGGLDSTVVASLCKIALGRTNTYGIILPYKDTPKEALDHAYLAGRTLGIRYLRFNITPQIDFYFRNFPQADNIRRGNKIARERMSILYDLSYHFQGLVVGTSNKSEIYLGYGTIYGDLAWAINPIGDLYKTQIYQVAEYLKIPEEIIKKKPSAELWPGQTDEGELGLSYDEIDRVLFYYIDRQMNPEDIVKTKGISEDVVKKVVNFVKKSEFKRRLGAIAKIPDEVKYS